MAAVTTRKGKEILAGRMIGSTPTQAAPLFGSWGYNPNSLTAAATDVAFFQEGAEARVSGTASLVTTTTTNDTYQLAFTMTATGTRTVAEVGIFDASTQPAQGAVAATGFPGSNSSTVLNTAATFTPGNGNTVQIRTEVLGIVSGSGSTAFVTTRAQNGSTAVSTGTVGDPVTPGNAPGSTGVTGGSMFAHADHTPDGLSSGDSIAYTVKVQFT